MVTKKKYIKFSDQIRHAVDNSEVSHYAICKKLGIKQPSFSRFMSHKAGLKLATLDKLAKEIGFEIKETGKATKTKGK